MSNDATSVLSVARGELGYSRWTDPQTGTKYGRWYAEKTGCAAYGANGVAYCAMFASWVFDKAGASCVGLPGPYCPTIVAKGKAAGKTVATRNAQPGDLVLFDWTGDGKSDHVGIVEVNYGSYLQTIEGNTNNGQVARRTRAYSTVCCIIRPDYSSAPTPEPTPLGGTMEALIGTNAAGTYWYVAPGICVALTDYSQMQAVQKLDPSIKVYKFGEFVTDSNDYAKRICQAYTGKSKPVVAPK